VGVAVALALAAVGSAGLAAKAADGGHVPLALAMAAAANWQASAQSMSSAMQRAIIWASSSRRQVAAQVWHAVAQAWHSSMHCA
jgi:hypothetical protein